MSQMLGGFHWSKDIETFLMTPYSYSMGILAFFVGGTTAKALTDSMNRDLHATNQINFLSTMLASMVGFLLMAAEPAKEGGFLTAFTGTKGLLTAFIATFVTVNVYKVCVKKIMLLFVCLKRFHQISLKYLKT